MRLICVASLVTLFLLVGDGFALGKGPFQVNTKMLKGHLDELDMNIEDLDFDEFKSLFIKYDKDSNYKLDYDEFAALYWEEGSKMPEDITQYHFYHADANKDEVIDFEEILLFSVGSMSNFYERNENSRPNWVRDDMEVESDEHSEEGDIETYSPNPSDGKQTIEL